MRSGDILDVDAKRNLVITCPLAQQCWALSHIPNTPAVFSTENLQVIWTSYFYEYQIGQTVTKTRAAIRGLYGIYERSGMIKFSRTMIEIRRGSLIHPEGRLQTGS